MRKYSKELYSRILPEETGVDTGFMDVGFVELACDADRLYYYRKVAAFNRFCGIDVQEITPEQVKELFPLCKTDDVLAGFYVSSDGRVNPYEATMALAKGARKNGVQIKEGVTVDRATTINDRDSWVPRVTGVKLENGDVIEANTVVNCGGMWARQLGERNEVPICLQAVEHYYLITDKIPQVDRSWPVIEDSSRCVYIRPEGEGLMLGLFEWQGASWNADKIPDSFSFDEIQPDWDRMEPYLERAMERVPVTLEVGAKKLFCGPESFTPDNGPIVGEAPGLRNHFVAAGLNSIGILTGGGIGKVLAQWIRDGHAPIDIDVTGINVNRFQKYQANLEYRLERAPEAIGNTYKVHYPDHMPKTARGAKKSVLYDRLKKANAYFRDVSGWESPSWYAPSGVEPVVERESFERENWFHYWEAEHFSCRNDVALFDMSFMSKFSVQGKDAGAFLNRISTSNVNGDNGKITYTQWLNEQGYMEADLTVTKLNDESFMVVATDTMHNHVYTHMLRRLSTNQHVFVSDVTGCYTQINLQGPKSRELLQTLTSFDLSKFDFRQAAEIEIGLSRVLCVRITYVGELGYELFIPVEQATHVYDKIIARRSEYGLRHAGLRALGSLRMEKGYRDYGHDMDNTDTLLQCGLGFTCAFDKPEGFIGQEHVLSEKRLSKEQGGLRRRIASVLVKDPEPLLHHGEMIWRNGERISEIRAASYGHTLGGAVGLTMLETKETPITKDFIASGEWEVEIADRKYPCDISLAPLYDPKNTKVKV